MKYAVILAILSIILVLPVAYASNTDIVILASKAQPPVGQPIIFNAVAATNFPDLNTREFTIGADVAVSGFTPQIQESNFGMNLFTNFPQPALRETSIAFSALFAGFNQKFINNPISINAQANVQPITPQISENQIFIGAQTNIQPIMPQIIERQISVELESSIQPIVPQTSENPAIINAQANINPITPQVLQPTRIPSVGFVTNFPLNVGPGISFSGNIPLRALPEGPIRPTGEFYIRTVDLDRDFDP